MTDPSQQAENLRRLRDLKQRAEHDKTEKGLSAQTELIAITRDKISKAAKKRDPHYGYPIEWMNGHVMVARMLLWQARHPLCGDRKSTLKHALDHLETSQLTGTIWGDWYRQEQERAKKLLVDVEREIGLTTYLREDRDGR